MRFFFPRGFTRLKNVHSLRNRNKSRDIGLEEVRTDMVDFHVDFLDAEDIFWIFNKFGRKQFNYFIFVNNDFFRFLVSCRGWRSNRNGHFDFFCGL